MTPEEKLRSLGIELAVGAAPMGAYVPAVQEGNLVFLSGHPPMQDGEIRYRGRVGEQLTVEEGYQAARLCAINCLAALRATIGDLRRVRRVVKLLGFVNCGAGFTQQPQVLNGASDLLKEVFGERGVHARSAVGAPALPADIAVEVEMVVSVEPD